jgi:hypothetical protein
VAFPEKKARTDEKWVLLTCLVLFLTSLLHYLPTTGYDFTLYDDHRIILEHPQLYANGTVLERIQEITWGSYPREEPLIVRDLSWLLDSVVFGFENPFGYHLGNVFYHALTVVLAFLLLLRLSGYYTALFTAAIFSVLAVHAEPIAWIMGRKDILSTLFSIGSILLFLTFQEKSNRRSRIALLAGSLFLAVLAYLSKINAVVLPGLIGLFALMNVPGFRQPNRAWKGWAVDLKRILLPLIPFVVLAIVVYSLYRANLVQYGLLDKGLDYDSEGLKKLLLYVNPHILLKYLELVFYPSNLAAYYTEPSLHSSFTAWQKVQGISIIVAIPAVLLLLYRLNRVACLLLLCFFIGMLPYLNWVNLGFWYANRYVYFPSLFLIAAAVVLLAGFSNGRGLVLLKGAGSLLLAYSFVHNAVYRHHYTEIWRDGETLWTHEVSLPGASIHDFNKLTAVLIGKAERSSAEDKLVWLEKARAANERALGFIVPGHDEFWLAVTYFHQGLILAYQGAPNESQLAAFSSALSYSPDYPEALWALAFVYLQLAQEEESETQRFELARRSLSFFNQYFKRGPAGASMELKRQQINRIFQTQFPELMTPSENQ